MKLIQRYLVAKVGAVVLVVVALGFATSTVYMSHSRQEAAEELLRTSARRMAESVGAGLRHAMLSGNGADVRRLIQDTSYGLPKTTVKVYDPNGVEVFGKPLPPVPPENRLPHVRSALNGVMKVFQSEVGQVEPIPNEERCQGCHDEGAMRGVLTLNTDGARLRLGQDEASMDALAGVIRAAFIQVMTGQREDLVDGYLEELTHRTPGVLGATVYASDGEPFFGQGLAHAPENVIQAAVADQRPRTLISGDVKTRIIPLENQPRCQGCHEDDEGESRGAIAVRWRPEELQGQETIALATVVSLQHTMLAGLGRLIVGFLDETADTGLMTHLTLHDHQGRLYHDPFTEPDVAPSILETLQMGIRHVQQQAQQVKAHGHDAYTASVGDRMSTWYINEDDHFVLHEPLLNEARCQQCHGGDRPVRGVISVEFDIADELEAQRASLWESGGMAIATVILVVFLLYLGLRMMVLRPIHVIGRAAEAIGNGDLEVVVDIQSDDEVGRLADRINGMTKGLREKSELSKFVSQATFDEIQNAPGRGIQRGGERRRLTLLFSDIRGFTSYSEEREPEQVVEMLNSYLQVQAQVVSRHGGDIDKFVGDELMARFDGEDQCLRAARCAVDLLEAVEAVNERLDPGRDPIRIGVGLNTADVILGAMGSAERMDFTAIGDGVNLAARLCANAGPGEVLASRAIRDGVQGSPELVFTALEPIQVKGKKDAVEIYDVRSTLQPPPMPGDNTRTL